MLLGEVGTYIVANSSYVEGTDLFYGFLPETPDNCLALYELTSSPPDFTLGTDLPVFERPRIQMYVRNTSYSTGRSAAETIWQLLTKISNQDLTGVRYHRIQAISSVQFLSRDKNRRSTFTANLDVTKVPSTP